MRLSNVALPLLAAAVILVVGSCRKNADETMPPTPSDDGPNYGELVLWDNVTVVDGEVLVLDVAASDFGTGDLILNFTGSDPGIVTGDVVIGADGDGYIRRVTSMNVTGNTITLATTQGYLTDVFRSGGIQLDFDMSDMDSVRSNGFNYSTGPRGLYQNGPLTVRLNEAGLEMDPDWKVEMAFNDAGLSFFEFSTGNTTIHSHAKFEVIASQQGTLLNRTDTLNVYSKRIVRWVTVPILGIPVQVPIPMNLDLRLMADYSAQIAAAYQQTAELTADAAVNVGVRYQNGGWQGLHGVTPNASLVCSSVNGSVELTGSYALRPQIALRLYGITGPYLSISPTMDATGAVNTELDWEVKVDGYLRTVLGADVQIFGEVYQPFGPGQWETAKLTFRTPQRITRISGDNQSGNANSPLPQPLRVRVFDSADRLQANVPVYFTVVAGSGSVNPVSILTDAAGYAETTWTLGSEDLIIQRVEASAKWPDGEAIQNAPSDFAATISTGVEDDISYCINLDQSNSGGYVPCVWDSPDVVSVSYDCGSVALNLIVHRVNGIPTSAILSSSSVTSTDYFTVVQDTISCPGIYGSNGETVGEMVAYWCGSNYLAIPITMSFSTPTEFSSATYYWSGLLEGSQAFLTYQGREYVLEPC